MNGSVYVEAVVLKNSYMYKYKFHAALKRKAKTRPQNRPAPQPHKPSYTETNRGVESKSFQSFDELKAAMEQAKKLEGSSDKIMAAIEQLNERMDQLVQRLDSFERPQSEEQENSSPFAFEYGEYTQILRRRFSEQADHIIEQAKETIPPELTNDPIYNTLQKLLGALSSSCKTVQEIKQAGPNFRFPILQFSALVNEKLKNMIVPGQAPDFHSVSVLPYQEFLRSEYMDGLCQNLSAVLEPPVVWCLIRKSHIGVISFGRSRIISWRRRRKGL